MNWFIIKLKGGQLFMFFIVIKISILLMSILISRLKIKLLYKTQGFNIL